MHHHPALEALGELCGPMGYYGLVVFPKDHRITAADLDKLEHGLRRLEFAPADMAVERFGPGGLASPAGAAFLFDKAKAAG